MNKMISFRRIKTVLWLLLLIVTGTDPVRSLTTFVASNVELDHGTCRETFLDRILYYVNEKMNTGHLKCTSASETSKVPMASEVIPLYQAIGMYIFTNIITKNVTRSEEHIKQSEYNLPYFIKATLYGVTVAVCGHSVLAIYMSGFSALNAVLMTVTMPILSIPHIDRISSFSIKETFLAFQETYLEEWGIHIFQKEKPIPLPPPENFVRKFLKVLFPGVTLKNADFHLKDIVKYITDKTGFTLNTMVLILFLTTVTSLAASLVHNYFQVPDDKEEDFTDEDFLDEYKDNPDIHQILKEWLTPQKQKNDEQEKEDDCTDVEN